MTKQIKVAVIGCGHWGKNLIRNFSELNALGAVCDDHPALAKQFAQTYQVPHLSFQEVLNASDIEGIVIATPVVTHARLAEAALKAGKAVFVEKPLAHSLEEAQKLKEVSEKTQKILMVGHLLQYHPAFIKLKSLVREGKLGKLQYIYSNRLNLGKFRREENILWSFAPHDISMILSLLPDPMPTKVMAMGTCQLHNQIQDVTTTHLTFSNGLKAHIFVSWLHPFKEQKLVVIGERAMAVFDDSQDWSHKLQLYPEPVDWKEMLPQASKAQPEPLPLEPKEPLKEECLHFLTCIEKQTTPRTCAAEGIAVLTVLDAAQRSLQTEKEVLLESKTKTSYFQHDTALVDEGCDIAQGVKIWHFSHILSGSKIGENCIIGQNVMIGPDVTIGKGCKIQNNVSLYKGVTLGNQVFCGPSAVFTNVHNPRAHIERKEEFRPTLIEDGVSIGANATIVCGVRLGAYSFIGAGAVVTKDVKPHALMVGNPAKQIGWMSHAGEKLTDNLQCPRENRQYFIDEKGGLQEWEKALI